MGKSNSPSPVWKTGALTEVRTPPRNVKGPPRRAALPSLIPGEGLRGIATLPMTRPQTAMSGFGRRLFRATALCEFVYSAAWSNSSSPPVLSSGTFSGAGAYQRPSFRISRSALTCRCSAMVRY